MTTLQFPPDGVGITMFSGGSGPAGFQGSAGLAVRAENAGFSTAWTSELYSRSATVPLAVAASRTERCQLGSCIAYGVGRTPMIWAAEARDLDHLSNGRFILGIGNGTSGMMEHWHGVDGEAPALRTEEFVEVFRKLWRLHDGTVEHDGRFYHVKIKPTFEFEGPITEHLPIYTAGLNPRIIESAGRVADGIFGHPMFTRKYIDDIVRPALEKGTSHRGRDISEVKVIDQILCAIGDDIPAQRRRIAQAISHYGASSAYRRLFELHGWGDARDRIQDAAKQGDQAAMLAEVTDEMVDAIGIACSVEDLPAEVARMSAGLDHVNLVPPPWELSEQQLLAASRDLVDAMEPALSVAVS